MRILLAKIVIPTCSALAISIVVAFIRESYLPLFIASLAVFLYTCWLTFFLKKQPGFGIFMSMVMGILGVRIEARIVEGSFVPMITFTFMAGLLIGLLATLIEHLTKKRKD